MESLGSSLEAIWIRGKVKLVPLRRRHSVAAVQSLRRH